MRQNGSAVMSGVALALSAGLVGCGGTTGEPPKTGATPPAASLEMPSDPVARAKALQASVPLIDGHNDLPSKMRNEGYFYDFDKVDIRDSQPQFHTDIPRLKMGQLGAQFWSVYVPASLPGPEAVRTTLEQVNAVHLMARRYPETFEIASTADDIERVFKSGKIASLMGMEGGHSIDSSLPTLHMFYRLGVRYMTLTHSSNIPWADSATDTPKLGGLSKFGEAVVAEMNWLGMLVDLSHVSPDTMEDALRVTQAPVIFSHSSARALCDVPRDVPDAVLQKLPANGGVVMVTFVPGFISQETADHGKLQQAERERLQKRYPKDEEKVRAEMAAWSSAHPEPRASLAQVADHIDHIKQVAGIDHIGIGSDFDGIGSVPVGLEDVSKYPALTAELVRRGYNDDDIRKILGLNVLRALRGAEGVAKKLQAERQPSVKTIQELDEGKPPVVERER
ncbi:MAG: dipeptidase [Vicinamibacterales bacterium]